VEPIAIAAIAIGFLAVIGGIGWWVALRSKKEIGHLRLEVKTLEGEAESHEREHEAITEHERVGDLIDDSRFLRDDQ
jgi:hypothetical protein